MAHIVQHTQKNCAFTFDEFLHYCYIYRTNMEESLIKTYPFLCIASLDKEPKIIFILVANY